MNLDQRIDRLTNKHQNLKRETLARAKVLQSEMLALDEKIDKNTGHILQQLGGMESLLITIKNLLIVLSVLMIINVIAMVVLYG